MRAEWLSEEQAPGVRFSLAIEEHLLRNRTAYQEIELVRTRALGRALALDGRIMLTERDEAFYHEMLVHPALLAHACPQRVLIVGGGDGGAARTALDHPSVRDVTLAEIDREVIAAARTHLASIHRGALDDPRVRVEIVPAEAFLPLCREAFDAIVVDSTDPVGPGQPLFEHAFLASCRRALRPGGAIALQAGSPFYHPRVLRGLVADLQRTFTCVHPYLGFVPSYPSGLWAYVLAGDEDLVLDKETLWERFTSRGLTARYYTPQLGGAAFALPRFVEELLEKEER